MIKLNIHTLAGKTVTLHFAYQNEAEVTAIAIQYSDWLATGDETDAPLIDRPTGGTGRLVIPFRSIEFMEIER